MTNLKRLISLTTIICISCTQNNILKDTKSKHVSKANIPLKTYRVDTIRLSTGDWTLLKDTARYDIRYLHLNFLNFPNEKSVGQDIMNFKDSINTKSFLLTNKQEYKLYQLINDKTNFSNADCGTFHLNAGIFVLDNDEICGTINIGCGYNQWNFSSQNSNAKWGSFNDKGFKKMGELVDEIEILKNVNPK